MSSMSPHSNVGIKQDQHNPSEQAIATSALDLTGASVRTPPGSNIGLSESIPSDSGTPSISFKKKPKADSIHTPTALHPIEIDENLSPNCRSVCTSTPTSTITACNSRLSFKDPVGHSPSPLTTSNSSSVREVNSSCGPRDSPPLSDYSAETAQSSFRTARAQSDCSDTSLVEQETSQKLHVPEFTTPSESFEANGVNQKTPFQSNDLCQTSSVFLGQIYSREQRETDQSIMGDVSMMSVDGNMSIDVRDDPASTVHLSICTEKGPSKPGNEQDENASPVTTNDAALTVSLANSRRRTFNVDEVSAVAVPDVRIQDDGDIASSKQSVTPTPTDSDVVDKLSSASGAASPNRSPLLNVTEGSHEGSRSTVSLNDTFDKTPNASRLNVSAGGGSREATIITSGGKSPQSKHNNTFDKERSSLDVGLPASLSETASVGSSGSRLNDTFDKGTSEGSRHNDTFEKEPLPNDANYSAMSKTSELDLRLDQTCQPEESVNRTLEKEGNVSKGEQKEVVSNEKEPPRTPEKTDFNSRSQSTPLVTRAATTVSGSGESQPELEEDTCKGNTEKEDATKDNHDRRSSGNSFLKRRCSLLELSFVSSPKRQNFQPNTPKGPRKSVKSNLLHRESIAFDFSAAAATARKNNGVAEMGSFVFSATSGEPIASDIFDLSVLEKMTTSSKTKDQYTRVSFIAMFDPIKPTTLTTPEVEDKSLAADNKATDATDFSSPKVCTATSPLIKGLPTPPFVKPKSVNHIGVQTSFILKEDSFISEPAAPEIDYQKPTEQIAELKEVIEKQRAILALYEKTITVVSDRLRAKKKEESLRTSEHSEEVDRLKEALAAERDRNAQQDDVVRNLERSLHETLFRMAECRQGNAALAKVVEEQLAAMTLTRANCDELERHRDEVLSNANDEIELLKAKAQEDERTHKKALNLLELQLKAKESELESNHSQLAIAKKEIDTLRAVVQQMNLQ